MGGKSQLVGSAHLCFLHILSTVVVVITVTLLLLGTGRRVLHFFMDEVAAQHGEVVRAASSHRHAMEQPHSKRQLSNVRSLVQSPLLFPYWLP
jgi:hypothetical protein